MIVWRDRHFMAEDQAAIPVTDRGLTLGDGVFDTALAVDGAVMDCAAHFTRLRAHAAVMDIPLDTHDFAAAAHELLARNGFTAGRYAIRTTVTRGPGLRGLLPPAEPVPTVIMRASPVPAAADDIVKLAISPMRRNEGSPLSRIKSLNYGDNVMALLAARAAGADDAVMLNNRGEVACASASNIFVMVDNIWITPPLSAGAMDGIIRAQWLRDGRAREETIAPQQLRGADIILTNSVMGARRAALI